MTLNNIDNADIRVINRQSDGQDTDEVELVTSGRFYRNNGKFYIMYREQDEQAVTSTMIKVDGDTVSVKREGAYSSHMVYKKQTEHSFLYTMPYGALPMKLRTNDVGVRLKENGGKVILDYILYINEQPYQNHMTVTIQMKDQTKGNEQ